MAKSNNNKKPNNFASIKRLASLPVDLKLITPKSTITLEDYQKKYKDLGHPEEECIVIKNAEWISHSRSKNYYISFGKEGLMFYDPNNFQVFTQVLENGDWLLDHHVSIRPRKEILEKEGDSSMSKETENIIDEALNNAIVTPDTGDVDAILDGFDANSINIEDEASALTKSDNFGEGKHELSDAEKEAKAAEREQKAAEKEQKQNELVDTIKKAAEGVQFSNTAAIAAFNKAHGGCLVGYITNNDELLKISPSTVEVTDNVTGTVKTVQGATKEEQKDAAENKAVSKSTTRKEVVLKPKHTMPGKLLGIVVKIPEGGIVDYQDYLAGKPLLPDASKTDLKIILGDKDKMTTLINTCYRNVIPEDKETFGEGAGDVILYARPRKDKHGNTKFIKGFKSTSGRSYIQPEAYLPLNVYKTYDQTKALTEVEAEELATSQLINLLDTTKANNTPAIRRLDSKSRQKVHVDEKTNKITSPWFTADASKKESLKVKPYFTRDKEASLTSLPFAVKKKIEPKTAGKKATWRWVTYSIADSSEEAKNNNSLALARAGKKFSKFYNACGGDTILNESSLMALKPSRRKSSASNEIPDSALNTLIASELAGRSGLTNTVIDAEALNTDLLAMLGMQAG